MADSAQVLFDHKEVAELLVKKAGIHEGIWSLVFELKFGAALTGSPEQAVPTGLVGIGKIGIQRGKDRTSISVNAAEVNPAPPKTPTPKRLTKK